MLLRFELENWASFRDSAELSLVASRERQHRDRLPRVEKFRMSVLPVAAIYGGNASGKTNFFKALSFAKRFIVRGTQPDAPIGIRSFLLDAVSAAQPTRMTFELLIDELVYELSFAVDAKRVLEESLTRITSTSESVLYHRRGDSIDFDESLRGRSGDVPYLRFAFQGTRDNELFLTNSVSQNVVDFKPVYTWFRDQLNLIAPGTSFIPSELLVQGASPLGDRVCEALVELDTGVTGLAVEDVRLDDLDLPEDLVEEIRQKTVDGGAVRFRDPERNERFVITADDSGDIKVGRLVTRHAKTDGSEVTFDLRNEADGTQRAIDLLPAFCDLGEPGSRRVYFIDELDRSLHSMLTRQLLTAYLDHCSPESRSQLIFTTHDLLLIDQDLLRRDEMWVTERAADGSSTLFSFGDYEEIRYDKDIRRSYLQGRLGGVPRLLYGQCMGTDSCETGDQ